MIDLTTCQTDTVRNFLLVARKDYKYFKNLEAHYWDVPCDNAALDMRYKADRTQSNIDRYESELLHRGELNK